MTESWDPRPPDSAPGWHADPWFTGQYRWWDGAAWSGDVFPAGVAPYGSGPVVMERPPYERPPSPPPWQRATPPPPPPKWVIQNVAAPDVAPTVVETLESPPSRPRLSSTAILALLLVFGIALGTTIGLLTARSPSKRVAAVSPPSSPTPGPPPSSSVPSAPASPSQTPSEAPSQAPSQAPSGSQPGAQPAVPPGPSTTGLLQRFSLRQSDLPGGQQLALIPGGDTVNDPTLDLCNGTYASEKRRVARLQLTAETADGSTPVGTEAVLYDSPAATAQAFAELQRVASSCPSTPVTSPVGEATTTTRFGPRPDSNWPTVAGVQRLAYAITTTDTAGNSSNSTVIYLRRGKALLGLYLPAPAAGGPTASVQGKTSAADITAIFEQRLAGLPASAIGA